MCPVPGGLRLYAVPVKAEGKVIGAINFGYGDPPSDEAKLKELANKYDIPLKELRKQARAYKSRPQFIIDLAKHHIQRSAKYIGNIIERKLAEKAALENKQKLRITLDSIGDAVIATDLHAQITLMNPEAERLCGFTLEQAKGKNLTYAFNIVNALTGEKVENPVKKALQTGNVAGLANHTILISKDGNKCQIADSASPIRDEHGNISGVVLVFRDVTGEYRIREKMKASKERYRAVFENTGTATCLLEKNGTISLANGKFAKLAGYSLEEIQDKKKWMEFVVPEDLERMRTQHELRRKNREQALKEYEFRFIRADKEVRNVYLYIDMIAGTDKSVASLLDITERKQAEEELKFNYALLQIAGESARFGGWSITPDDERCTWCDIVAEIHEEPHGFSPLVKDGINYYAPEWREKITEVFTRCAQKGVPYDEEMEIITAKGNRRWVRTIGKPEWDEKGKIVRVSGSFQDITVIKEAERKIALATQQLKYHIENSPLAVIEWDENFRIIRWTARAEEFFGWSEEEVINKYPAEWKFVHGDDAQEVNSIMGALLNGEVKKNISSNRNYAKDGSIVHCVWFNSALLDENGKLLSILSLVHNVTEHKKAEESLMASEKKFRSLAENTSDVIAIMDLQGKITYMSRMIEDETGYTKDEIEGTNIQKLLTPESYNVAMNRLQKRLRGENINTPFEVGIVNKTGKVVPFELNTSDITENGEIQGIQLVARDITERKKAEAEIINARNKAEESDRLKSAFLANMSHEIRTPMNGIMGFAELLKDPHLSEEQQQQYIDIIEKGGERMLNIINDIVDISRIEAGLMDVMLEESDINEQLEFTYSFFKPEVEAKGMQLVLSNILPAEQAKVVTDREKLFAVLTNLIKNAIKYSKEGTIEYGCRGNESYLEFFVKDTGIGIPKDRQQAIFSRFVQADIEDKAARQGAGLGLSISKAYVEMLGGNIRVESEEGKGSIFYFTIPYN